MKLLIAFLFFFLSLNSFANILQFEMNIKFIRENSIRESVALVSAKLGGEFLVEREDIRAVFSVSEYQDKENPYPSEKKALLILGRIYEKNAEGNKLLSKPQIITLLGEEATISVEEESGDIFEIKMRPSKI